MSLAQRSSRCPGRRLAHPLLAAAVACGCGAASETAPERAVPRVEYAGCQRAFAGPVCMLDDELRLTLWVAAPADAQVEIEVDGRPLESDGVEVQLGRRFELDLADTSRRLAVRVDGSPPWELALSAPESPAWWREANSHLAAREFDAALSVVEKARAAGHAELGRELSARARIAYWSGEPLEARKLLERALGAHRERGEHLQEAHDAAQLFRLVSEHDLAAARRVLADLPDDWNGPAEAAYIAAYFPALLANETGDLRNALRWLRTAFEQAERLGLDVLWVESGQVLARQLQELGRSDEAGPLLDRLVAGIPEEVHPCWEGPFLNNVGWISLLALEAGEDAEDPTDLLEKTLDIIEQGCPRLPGERLNVTLNLALAHLHAGRLDEARRRLAAAKELGVSDLRLALWLHEIEARITLAEGRAGEALRILRELAELADAGFSPEARWRMALGEAGALESLGRRSEALAAFAEAERWLDQAALMVPLTEGRATFVEKREDGIRRYLDLLLDAGRETEALEVARRARSRVLRGLLREGRLAHLSAADQERWDRALSSYRARRAELDAEAAEDWRLPRDRLRRRAASREAARQRLLRDLDDALAMLDRRPEPGGPAPLADGELLLLFHPLPSAWVGFAQDGDGQVARRLACRIEDLPPEPLGACLLGPFADRIAAARQFRVLPYGALTQVDFHALPLGGDVLLAAGPVVYGSDLERRPVEPAVHPPHALLVADPGGDLPAARREADAVAAALSPPAGDWRLRSLRGTAATGAAVRDLLPHVDLVHYAGHAVFAGFGGWESALPLADGSRLTVGDVLTLERVPRWIVLSGCETAGTERPAAAESVTLAHAFLAVGAESVVATTRPVADATANRLIAAFYRAWTGGSPASVALRDAQLGLRRDDPAADWAAFRLVGP